jgi:hypothetical protein
MRRSERALGSPQARLTRTVAELRDRRVRDADLGRLVQQSPAAAAIGNIPPPEAEARYYAMINEQKLAA